jgi:protein-tyrosine phosphatase
MTVLRLLFLCTGNICRSPSAEFLLRARLDSRLGPDAKQFEISSAGLGTPGGWLIDPKVDHLLQEKGLSGQNDFRSRRVEAPLLADADLILTGTKQHRLRIGADFPDAYNRTFTMREAAALLARADAVGLPPYDVAERGRALIALLQRERGHGLLPEDQFDIADPHGHRMSAYKSMFEQVQGVVEALAFVLAPASVLRYGKQFA